jgi:hypothetical protein
VDNAKHFRSKELCGGLIKLGEKFNIIMNWSYFGEYHGKSVCDIRFSFISKCLKDFVLWNREQDKQIRTSEDIVAAINEAERRIGNISLQYILDELKKPIGKITINWERKLYYNELVKL